MKELILIVMLLGLVGCDSEAPRPEERGQLPSRKVETWRLKETEGVVTQEYAGTLVPLRSAKLATRLSGWITELRVEEGDFVRAGQVLVRIDSQDIQAQANQAGAGLLQAQAQIRQARAAVSASSAGVAEAGAALAAAKSRLPEAQAQRELARAEFRRMDLLYREGALSQLDYDRFKTQMEVAEAKVAQIQSNVQRAAAALARARSSTRVAQASVGSAQAGARQAQAGQAAALVPLQYAALSTPIDGFVVRKMAYRGEMASPGQPLLEIQDTRTLRLEVPVPESALHRFEPNQEFPVLVDATQKQYLGRLEQVVPSGDSQSRTFLLKIDVDNGERRLLPGMYGRIQVEEEREKQLLLPVSALVQRGEIQGVFVVGPEDRAEYRLVKLGEKREELYKILSGLEAEIRVVLNPPAGLKSGTPLEWK